MVTRDDLRKLIGGYATGTLTESERRMLFEAALDDQELFEELAHEQALKETLDQPGAKQRLITALLPEKKVSWWRRPMAWSAIGAVAVGTLALAYALRPKAVVQEIARVEPAFDAVEQRPAASNQPS